MSKHRRPSRLARARSATPNPLQMTIAAGVAGTVAVTGTVVAVADDSGSSTVRTVPKDSTPRPAALDNRPSFELAAAAPADVADLGFGDNALDLRAAVREARVERAERKAYAEARAVAKRKAEKRALERRALERRVAHRKAERRRALQSSAPKASRGVERMSASAANVLEAAAAVVASGARYGYGGTGPSTFDCSGFTSYVFAKVGITLPRTSSAQRSFARPVSSPQPGDLVFVYNGPGGSIGHVGIYAGGGYWWEAANPSTGVGKHRAWSSAVSYGRVL